jgi:hypothetical protein
VRLDNDSVRSVLVNAGFRNGRPEVAHHWDGSFTFTSEATRPPVVEVVWHAAGPMREDRAREQRRKMVHRYAQVLRRAGYECRISNGRRVLVTLPKHRAGVTA